MIIRPEDLFFAVPAFIAVIRVIGIVLILAAKAYGLLVEGHTGQLCFQGTWFQGFRRGV